MTSISETDLRLVDALQVNPRASWASLSATLGMSAMTVARRWRALSEAGLAWTGSTMGPALFRGVFLQLDCAPAAVMALADRLMAMPEMLTVGTLTGESALYAIVVAPTPDALSRFVGVRLPAIADSRVRVDPYFRVFGGPTWRLGVLDPDEAGAIRRRRGAAPPAVTDAGDERRLFMALAGDGRRTITDLADELDTTTEAVTRRLFQMQDGRRLTLRADLARPAAGWPLAALVRLAVPEAELLRVGRDLATWPETRFCAATTATSNLVVIVNLRNLDSMGAIAERVAERHPAAVVTERSVVPRLLKVNGRLLDEGGRSAGLVPVDPWTN